MTITVAKWHMAGQATHLDGYRMEMSAIELEYLRKILAEFGEYRTKGDTEECRFASKCATIINNALVDNGD